MEKKVEPVFVSETVIQGTDSNTFLATLVLMLSCVALILLVYLVLESRKINQL